MSLSVPAAPVTEDDPALTGEEDFVCDAADSPLAAIEKCLDNGVGACLVVDGRHYLGRVSLDELGRAALTGALLAPTLGQHLRELGRHRSNASPTDILQPDLDPAGNLIGVTVDRSAQRLQIARPDMARPGCEPETRIAIVDVADFDTEELRTLMDEAALVAPCLGYRSATLPIIDQAGHRLALRADANGDAVGDDCRLVLADGSVLPNVYGIGLGSGFRPSRGMGCEPNFSGQANSLWLYQNDIGGTIYSGIHERKAAPADTVVQTRPRNPAAGWTPPMPIP